MGEDGDHRSIARRGVVEPVGRHEACGADHVLGDQRRMTGEMAPHETRQEPRVEIESRAHLMADHDAQIVGFIEGFGVVGRGHPRERTKQHEKTRQD